MLGVWSMREEQDRDLLQILIANMPADGRYEVEIRQAAPAKPQEPPHDDRD